MELVHVMGTAGGRAGRIAAGAALLAAGAAMGGTWWVLAAVGLVPIAAGAFNFCLLGPVFHAGLRSAHRG